MLQELTPENYRRQQTQKFGEIRDIITENYGVFWNVAKKLQEEESGGTKIETPFGDWTIVPNPKLDIKL